MRLTAGATLLTISLLLTGAPILALASVILEGQPPAVLSALGRANLPALALSTLSLALGATLWALVIAVPLAWLVARTDVPLRRLVRQLAPLPLAIPPYVAALAYAMLLGPGPIYGAGGAAFVLGTFTAPSLFLIVHGAFERADPSLEEASRGLGRGPWQTLLRVTLPLVWPAILAGALLVFRSEEH